MKTLSKVLAFVFIAALILSVMTPAVFAEDEYTYSVTLYSGSQGSFSGQDSKTFDGLQYGQVVNLSDLVSSVKLDPNSKYYIKGIRPAGHDNSETGVTPEAFIVKGDAMYIVTYGLKGDLVSYTVKYQDADGKELAASRTYYGNIGEKPIVAYRYIEGYQPRSYNLTKTLSANAADNVFVFEYTKVTVTTEVIIIPGNDDDEGQDEGGTEQPGTTEEPAETEEPDDTGATQVGDLDQTNGNGDGSDVSIETPAETPDNPENPEVTPPQELIDLDDPDVALADLPGTETTSTQSTPSFLKWVIAGVAFLVVVAAAVYFALIRKKKEE